MNEKGIKKIEKIVVNAGIGRLSSQPNFDKVLPAIVKDFSAITGQKPAFREAKKSVSGFKLREGTTVGLTATLRGSRMAYFLEKFCKVVLPRIRDFRGIDKKSVDERGNLSVGVKENVVFPEINPDISRLDFGLQITVVPKLSEGRERAIELYKEIGIPFKK
ncbi:MAG TPA: 50S ribosomal protein L5 [Candidatus Paceibacterota bacterium]